MMLRKSVLGAAGLIGLAGSLAFHGCSSENGNEHGGETSRIEGELELALTLPDGSTVNALQYSITGPVTRNGSVDISKSSTARFRVGNLPVGTGYSITLNAQTSEGTQCTTTQSFAIAGPGVTPLTITLTCREGVVTEPDQQGDLNVRVDVELTDGGVCPVVTGIGSLGLEALVGGSIQLEGSASSTAGVSYAWSGTGGTFGSATSASTSFRCDSSGEHNLTFSISKTGCTDNSFSVQVTCTPTPTFSSVPAYVVPVAAGVTTKAIISVGDASGVKADGTPYRFVGLPDGIGAYDNGDGATFTLLSNHELGRTQGVARAHGAAGTFVSKWTIRKADLAVLGGSDLMRTVNYWNATTSSYQASNIALHRFCSADLPPASAFYHAASNVGFNGQLYMNGEEDSHNGRAMAHGLDGVSYELPGFGRAGWENIVASPHAQLKTIAIGLDDTAGGQVYVWVGNKTNSGSSVERAGLLQGKLYGVAIPNVGSEPAAGIPGTPAFTMADVSSAALGTGAQFETASVAAGVTGFNRPEDGAWDPSRPSDFYFVTTNSATAPSRLWRLRFSDLANPEAGGTIEMVLDGTEGQVMFDNLGIDGRGHIMLTEDPGGNPRLAAIWRYTIATDQLVEVARHNPELFTSGAPGFLTADEEASGIIDATSLLGAGYWLLSDQAHDSAYGGELVERGQLTVLFDPATR